MYYWILFVVNVILGAIFLATDFILGMAILIGLAAALAVSGLISLIEYVFKKL